MMLPSLLATCAGLLTLGGVGLLHASWRSLFPDHRKLLVFNGWLMLLLALVLWIESSGAEFGTVLGLCVPALAAWLLTVSTARTRQRKARRPRDESGTGSALDDKRLSRRRHLLLFVLSVPVAAVAATLLTVALAELLPGSELGRTVLVGFVMPPLWGLLAWWFCATPTITRTLLKVGVPSLAAALFLFL